jgi:hypothetical protein
MSDEKTPPRLGGAHDDPEDATLVQPELASQLAQADETPAPSSRRGAQRRPGAPQIRKVRPSLSVPADSDPEVAAPSGLPQLGDGEPHEDATLVRRSDPGDVAAGAPAAPPPPAPTPPVRVAAAESTAGAHGPHATSSRTSPAKAPLPPWVGLYLAATLALAAGGAIILYLQLRALGRI